MTPKKKKKKIFVKIYKYLCCNDPAQDPCALLLDKRSNLVTQELWVIKFQNNAGQAGRFLKIGVRALFFGFIILIKLKHPQPPPNLDHLLS